MDKLKSYKDELKNILDHIEKNGNEGGDIADYAERVELLQLRIEKLEKNPLKIKEITLSRSFKISKNYNSQDASMAIVIQIDENDDLEEVISEGYEFLNVKCKEQLSFKELTK